MPDQPPKTIPLFDTTAEILSKLKECPVEQLPPEMDAILGCKSYGRIFFTSEDQDINILNAIKDIASIAGIFPFMAKDFPVSLQSVVQGKNLKLNCMRFENGQVFFLLSADSKEAVESVMLDMVAKRVREMKDMILGGRLDKEWKQSDMSISLAGGKVWGGPENPLYEKNIHYDPAQSVEGALEIVTKYHKTLMGSFAKGPQEIGLIADKLTLEAMRKAEKVSEHSIGRSSSPSAGSHNMFSA